MRAFDAWVCAEGVRLGYNAVRVALLDNHGAGCNGRAMKEWGEALASEGKGLLAGKTPPELREVDEWAMGLGEGGWKQLGRWLAEEKGWSAGRYALREWARLLSALKQGLVEVSSCGLADYDSWGRASVVGEPSISAAAVLQRLQLDHGRTAVAVSIRRWVLTLRAPSKRRVYWEEWAEEEGKFFWFAA